MAKKAGFDLHQLLSERSRAEAKHGQEKQDGGQQAENSAEPTARQDEETVHLFRDSGRYKDDVFVAVNGHSVLIKRGETVRVRRMFAEVLERSMKQDAQTAQMMERESADFRRRAEQLNI